MQFAKYTFLVAGIYGLLILIPQYFLEQKNGQEFPPVINHPEYYYGFLGVALAWQIGFIIISRNPLQLRQMMLAAVIEKFSFVIAVFTLFALNRVAAMMTGLALVDLVLGVLFIISYLKTGEKNKA